MCGGFVWIVLVLFRRLDHELKPTVSSSRSFTEAASSIAKPGRSSRIRVSGSGKRTRLDFPVLEMRLRVLLLVLLFPSHASDRGNHEEHAADSHSQGIGQNPRVIAGLWRARYVQIVYPITSLLLFTQTLAKRLPPGWSFEQSTAFLTRSFAAFGTATVLRRISFWKTKARSHRFRHAEYPSLRRRAQ